MAAKKKTDAETVAPRRATGETKPAKPAPKREQRPISENPAASLNLLGRARKGR